MTRPRHEIYPLVAEIFPVDIRNALIEAANGHNIARIDQITDFLAKQGIVRPRDSVVGWFLPRVKVAA